MLLLLLQEIEKLRAEDECFAADIDVDARRAKALKDLITERIFRLKEVEKDANWADKVSE